MLSKFFQAFRFLSVIPQWLDCQSSSVLRKDISKAYKLAQALEVEIEKNTCYAIAHNNLVKQNERLKNALTEEEQAKAVVEKECDRLSRECFDLISEAETLSSELRDLVEHRTLLEKKIKECHDALGSASADLMRNRKDIESSKELIHKLDGAWRKALAERDRYLATLQSIYLNFKEISMFIAPNQQRDDELR